MSRVVEDRIVLAFLEQLAADAEAGIERPLDELIAQHPGHEQRLREEAELFAASLAGEAGDSDLLETDLETFGDASGTGPRLGPYRLQRALGRGGQGVVWLAEDERYRRTVALKVLPGLFGGDGPGVPARVQREVEAMARLDHPGLCVVHEAGEVEGQAYLAMRYVPGEALDKWVTRRREELADSERAPSGARRSVEQIVGLIEQVARALHAAHEAGVVHRDVKPGNIVVHENGQPVLLDFGLARMDDSSVPTLTRSGEILGTTPYMSPERLRGEGDDDPRADVWSLGVTLYELLCGRRPFEGATLELVATRVAQEEPSDPRRHDPSIPRDLAVVVATALEKSPARRYADAGRVADELARVLRGEPVVARPVSWFGRVRRWVGRNRAAAAVLALLSIGLVASVVATTLFADLARRERAASERNVELASSERDARLRAQALLARSAFEQARLLAVSDEPGRRERLLELVGESAAARDGLESDVELPELAALRELALDALVASDAEPLGVLQQSRFGSGGFSADGERFAISFVSADFTRFGVRVLDAHDGRRLHELAGEDLVSSAFRVAVSDDGRRLATPTRDLASIGLWDATRGERVADLPVPDALGSRDGLHTWRLAFTRDGRWLAGLVAPRVDGPTEPAGAVVWDLATREPVWVRPEPSRGEPWLALSADHDRLLVPHVEGGWLDVSLGDFEVVEERVDGVVLVAASTSAGTLAVIADATGQRLQRDGAAPWSVALDGRLGEPRALAVDRIHGRVALGLDDGSIALHDLDDGQRQTELREAHATAVQALAWSADGTRLLSHAEGGATKHWRPSPDSGVRARAPALDGRGVPAVDANVREVVRGAAGGVGLSVQALARSASAPARQLLSEARPTGARALVARDASRAARLAPQRVEWWSLSGDGSAPAGVFEPATDERVIEGVFAEDGRLNVLLQRDDGRHAVLGLPGAEVLLDDLAAEAWWRLRGPGRWLLEVPSTGAQGDARLAHGALRVYDVRGEHESVALAGLDPTLFRQDLSTVVSADERWIAVHLFTPTAAESAEPDHAVWVWELPSGRLAARIPVDRGALTSPAFSPDGRWLAIPEPGGRLRWHAPEGGALVLAFTPGPAPITWLGWPASDVLMLRDGDERGWAWRLDDTDGLAARLAELGLALEP